MYGSTYTLAGMSETQAEPTNPVERAIKAAGISKLQLSRELGIGTTTIWRACTGKPIEPKAANKLRSKFPDLDFEALTLGTEEAKASSESGEHGLVDPAAPADGEKREAAAGNA